MITRYNFLKEINKLRRGCWFWNHPEVPTHSVAGSPCGWDGEADGAGAWPSLEPPPGWRSYGLVGRGSWVSSVLCELSNTGQISRPHLLIYKPGREECVFLSEVLRELIETIYSERREQESITHRWGTLVWSSLWSSPTYTKSPGRPLCGGWGWAQGLGLGLGLGLPSHCQSQYLLRKAVPSAGVLVAPPWLASLGIDFVPTIQ